MIRLMGKGKKKGKKRKRGKRRAAERADPHDLYQRSVQSPQADIEFFLNRFEKSRRRVPRSLREDFCGTAYLSSVWVRGEDQRTAIAIDLDPSVLEWGRSHNLRGRDAKRLELRCADVRDVTGPPVDLACAMNFSFCVFKTREELRHYFEVVHHALVEDGMFICELYGGTEAIIELQEEREVEDFTFIWEQEKFNPVSHETLCHIHFELEDGSRLEKAFTYDWRLWSIPEIRELLVDAGFRRVEVYWEEVDDEGDGTGEHHLTAEEENQEGWLVYIVAAK
jgi:SAM-dependent methyltransferase